MVDDGRPLLPGQSGQPPELIGHSRTGLTHARLRERFAPEMQAAMSADALQTFRKQVDEQLGGETGVVDEKVTPTGPYQVYTRTASFAKFPGKVVVQWTLDGEGKVGGFFVRPAPQEPSRST